MNKYYVIKSTIESTKEVFYLKHPWGFILTENLVEAKLFSSYETARKTMDYAKNKQDLFIDEIVEVKVDNFGNVVEIEGGKEMQKLYVVTAINQGKGSKGVFYLSDKEGLVLTENVENAYFFKNRTLAKEYVNEVEGNYPEYDLVVSVQEVVISAEGVKLNSVEESQTSEITLLLDGKILAEHVINEDFFDEPLVSTEAVAAPKENELHQMITEGLFNVIAQIAELSVNEYPRTQHEIKSRLKSIIDSEIELAWSVAKLARRE